MKARDHVHNINYVHNMTRRLVIGCEKCNHIVIDCYISSSVGFCLLRTLCLFGFLKEV